VTPENDTLQHANRRTQHDDAGEIANQAAANPIRNCKRQRKSHADGNRRRHTPKDRSPAILTKCDTLSGADDEPDQRAEDCSREIRSEVTDYTVGVSMRWKQQGPREHERPDRCTSQRCPERTRGNPAQTDTVHAAHPRVEILS